MALNQTVLLTPGIDRVRKLVQDGIFTLDPASVQALQEGKLHVEDQIIYIRWDCTGKAGIYRLLDRGDVIDQGIRNINAMKLPEFTNFLAQHVRIGYSGPLDASTITNPTLVTEWKHKRGELTPAIEYGKIEITQLSKKIFNLEADQCLSHTDEQVGHQLDVPFTINGGPEIDMTFEYVNSVPATADKVYYQELVFTGIGTRIVQ